MRATIRAMRWVSVWRVCPCRMIYVAYSVSSESLPRT
jgi:hypothetical protein